MGVVLLLVFKGVLRGSIVQLPMSTIMDGNGSFLLVLLVQTLPRPGISSVLTMFHSEMCVNAVITR